MRNLLRFIIRYHVAILFLFLEIIAIYLVIQKNSFQKSKFINYTRSITSSLNNKYQNLQEYFALKKINQQLLEENIELRNKLKGSFEINPIYFTEYKDTLIKRHYFFTSAKVINNSVNKQYNYLTLNKGSNHGIRPDMGVISADGIVGVVDEVSKNFSHVISVLNRTMKISAKIKNNDYFGSLEWDGKNFKRAILKEIPHHVKLNKGDTIVTTGYSAIFPANILVGFIREFNLKEGNFYYISVELANDFKNIHYVTIINNVLKEEQELIETTKEYD